MDTRTIENEVNEELTGDNEPAQSVRVPWLRYSGRPERKGPASPNAECAEAAEKRTAGPEAGNGAAARERERGYEPLLTEQELAALLGDDDLESRD